MNADQKNDLILLYSSGELSQEETARAERLLASDASSREELAFLKELQAALQLDGNDGASAVGPQLQWLPWAGTALVLGLLVGLMLWRTHNSTPADHAPAFAHVPAPSPATEVASQTRQRAIDARFYDLHTQIMLARRSLHRRDMNR